MIVELSGTQYEIKLEDGYYNYTQLASALQTELRAVPPVTTFNVTYDSITHKFTFINSSYPFVFRFDLPNNYDCAKDNYKTDVYAQHSNWGLGYILGFEKIKYTSSIIPHNAHTHQQLIAPNPCDLEDNKCIYIELEKYNKCDEIKPFLYYNYSNPSSGIVNSSFAKIPIPTTPFSQWFDKDRAPYKFYYPPAERMRRYYIKIRYHNGQLVNFGEFNYSFTLEFTIQLPQLLRSSNSVPYPPNYAR
jgi:hypothetical protein